MLLSREHVQSMLRIREYVHEDAINASLSTLSARIVGLYSMLHFRECTINAPHV